MEMNMKVFAERTRTALREGKVAAISGKGKINGELQYADGEYCIVGAGLTEEELEAVRRNQNGDMACGLGALEESGISIPKKHQSTIEDLMGAHDLSLDSFGDDKCYYIKRMDDTLRALEIKVGADTAKGVA